MNAVLNFLPLLGLVGAVTGLTVALTRRTRNDDERWTLDRRKRDRRDERSLGIPPADSIDRRIRERRRPVHTDASAN